MLYKAFIVNTPMFFESLWEDELAISIDKNTLEKIEISGSENHPDMLELIDEHDLPYQYGGECECKAQCIYSDRGPWTQVENNLDYQNPDAANDSDSDPDDEDFSELNAHSKLAVKGLFGSGPNKKEEFKMGEA